MSISVKNVIFFRGLLEGFRVLKSIRECEKWILYKISHRFSDPKIELKIVRCFCVYFPKALFLSFIIFFTNLDYLMKK